MTSRADLGSLDSVDPLTGSGLPVLYARQIALTARRVQVYSARLAELYAEKGDPALVREDLIFDPDNSELVVSRESITGLARLEGLERDRLDRQLANAIKLGVEYRAAAEVSAAASRMAALAQSVCREAGLDWSDPETRQLAQRAIRRVRTVGSA